MAEYVAQDFSAEMMGAVTVLPGEGVMRASAREVEDE